VAVSVSNLVVGMVSFVQVPKPRRQGSRCRVARGSYAQRSLGVRSECVAIVLFVVLLLLTATGLGKASRATTTAAVFLGYDSEGPSFDLSWMPDFADFVPDNRPLNLTLELVVGVEDPDGVDSVIGSYRNESQPEWTNVTMSEDLTRGSSGVYSAAVLNYTTPSGSFSILWQAVFYANDSLGNWNKSVMKNMSLGRQVGPSTFDNVTGVVVGGAIIVAEIAVAALCYVRNRE